MKTNIVKIDVSGILSKKFKWIPKFLFRPLEKLIRQDEINYYLSHQCAGKYGLPFLQAALDDCLKIPPENITIIGADHLPKDGRYTFVCNHPLGALDGLILLRSLFEYYTDVKIFMNKILADSPHLRDVAIPVDKSSKKKADIKMIRERINAEFDGDSQLVIFPAGVCSRFVDGVIQDLGWTSTFYTKSLRSKRGIVPIYFRGYNSGFYYKFAHVLRRLGIKANLPMALLPREMLNSKGKKYEIIIGEPIPYDTLSALSHNYTVKNAVYLIRKIVYGLDRQY